MKTILDQIISELPKNTYAELTTVWNYHSIKSWDAVLKNKNSNLHKLVSSKKTFSDEYLKNGITIFTGAKGYSQHSETQIILARGKQEITTRKGVYFSFDELKKLGVR